MKVLKANFLLIFVVVLLFGFAGSAFGDWYEGGPYKMHYPQLPNPVGWDVAFYGDLGLIPLELADDWQCTETSPVTDIHFWVSWMGDFVDPIIGIQAKIYSNNPVGPNGWSEPDYLLWEGVFQAGQFTERLYGSGPQGWYDPFFPEWFPDDHFQYYQINITDISEPFIQQVGEIYWLSLEIATPGGLGLVGWKTAIPPNFMDDAVWRQPGGPWIELRDPLTQDSLDFSFVITGDANEPNEPKEPVYDKPLEPHTKWSQPPIEVDPNSAVPTYCGWDEESYLLSSSDVSVQVYENIDSYFYCTVGELIADDIYLTGTNRELVHYNFTVYAPSETAPYTVTSELYTEEIYPDNNGYPGTPIAGTSCTHTVTSDGDVVLDYAPGQGVILPDKVWIVLSFSDTGAGWKIAEQAELGFTDDLVALYNYEGSGVWDLYWFEAHDPYAGFEANIWCKGGYNGNLVADDFRCIGSMPVTSIHWWGSHFGWEGLEPPLQEPIAWRIGFWSNVPEGVNAAYSYPQELLWQIEVPVDRVDVNNVGQDSFPGMPSDTCFQYYLDLNEEEYFRQAEFEPNTIDNIFWLSIAAVYPEGVYIVYPWGWKTRPWHWMDDAVTFTLNFAPAPGFALDPNFVNPIVDPGSGESYDLTFELDTDPNYIKWEQLYTGIRHWPHYEDEKSVGVTERWTEVETKWLQEPDLSQSGIDVDATMELTGSPLFPPQILADDFPCTTMGPITGISIWGSWYDDMMPMMDPTAVEFTLSIYSDNPVGPSGWSEPNVLLWRMDFPAGSFMVEPAGEEAEGYYSPCVPVYEPVNHFFAWKYSFNIDPAQAFVQQGDPYPVIYWLAVQARPIPDEIFTYRFGWKTSTMQWNDDAVWAIGELDPSPPWTELLHPENSLLSLDLAFEITTSQELEEFVLEQLVADDWRCERRTPVTAIAWWGSYIGYDYEACQGPVIDVPVKPDYFQLNIWTDVAAGEDPCVPYSHPNEIIWEYKAYDYDEVLVGYDKHPYGEPNEPVFRYSVRLPEEEWFKQPDVNSIFWLSILAVYDVDTPNYDWGWTNHQYVFNDDAVAGYQNPTNGEWVWTELFDQTGASEDMSFMLFTDPDVCINCADYNSDGIVDTRDLKIFADNWLWIGPSGGYCDSDLNCDGEATFVDYAIFAQQWLDSCP